MKKSLDDILQNNPMLWRGGDINRAKVEGISTGYKALDEILPAGGWPVSALVEVISARWGAGELQLLLPALIRVSQQPRRLVWIAPPFVPYAQGLANSGIAIEQVVVLPLDKVTASASWTMEKILKTQSCGIAMSWPERLQDKTIRRLQLAAEAGNSLGFLFRTVEAKSSAASIRIRINSVPNGLEVDVFKARGGASFKRIVI